MADSLVYRLVKNVEFNRQRLIDHCTKNGKYISQGASLSEVVTTNNEININTNIKGKCKVEFIDLDGSYIAPTQYVEVGGKATLPTEIPTFDSEYLEFVQWRTSADDSLDNVTRDILVMPEYQVKYDEATGQRPTCLICYFDDNALSPTFYFDDYSTSNYKNAYIDYGDGIVEQITKTSMPHTYAKKGLYTIKIYGDKYRVGGHSSYGFFGNSGCAYALLKAYLGNNIYSVGVYSFSQCYSLTNITIPNSVTRIGASAFSSCHSLTNITIPNSVTSISDNAFRYCNSLTNITMPNGVTSIGDYAFSSCHSLTNITIPNGVTSIGNQAFNGCYSLTNITIPNSVTSMNGGTFNNCYSLTNITIPNGVTSIGPNDFSNCYSLTNITIPNSVTSMNGAAFSNCYSLTNITLPIDFNLTIDLQYGQLTDACLINIANALKDNTDSVVQTITFSKQKVYSRANAIYLNSFGEEVPYGTEGAVSLLEFIRNKNWTVTFK